MYINYNIYVHSKQWQCTFFDWFCRFAMKINIDITVINNESVKKEQGQRNTHI